MTALIQAPAASARPQAIVECLGEHALCDAATDCKIVSSTQADCACVKVNENHLVVTKDIEDARVRAQTLRLCTTAHPCKVDKAPVCKAIRAGRYTVDRVTYPQVSTYSYRGWCETFRPVPCEGDKAGPWADCMAAPCTVDTNNPDRPLNCQCRLENGAFIGINGVCSTAAGEVMSTIARGAWSFEQNAFTVQLPGYDYVKSACAPLSSD